MKWNLITKKLQALGLTLALLTSGTLMAFATEEAIEEPNLTAAEESLEEAVDVENSILFEDISGESGYKLRQRAFRYIYLTGTESSD